MMHLAVPVCITVLLGFAVTSEGQRSTVGLTQHACVPISIPMCQEMPYNATKMPNLLRHGTQEEAAIMAHEFLPLVDIKCSPHARFFICSVFAPMCAPEISFGVPACRSVCEAVKQSCLPILIQLNFKWPEFLQCNSFPEHGLCMMPPDLHMTPGVDQGSTYPNLTATDQSVVNKIGAKNEILLDSSLNNFGSQLCSGFKRIWVPTTEEKGVCAPLCTESFLFTASDKRMALAWMTCWGLGCLASTAFSVLTFCLDTKRFNYPERPVICLALSYFFYCLPFVFGSLVTSSSLSCEVDPSSGVRHLTASGATSSGCIATFLLQYYFGFASDLWWTILTFCWFMSASRYWSSEGLRSYSTYFHLLAWGVPALGTVLAIIFKQIDADELTGLCYVGNLRPESLLRFVIIPQTLLLSLGTIFIVCGFVSLVRIRNVMRTQSLPSSGSVTTSILGVGQSSSTHSSPIRPPIVANHLCKLERLMVRLGVFSGLSTVPAVFVLTFRLHMYFNYDNWVDDAVESVGTSCDRGWSQKGCSSSRMILSLFRIFMSLVVGVTSGVWVWSPKTLSIWKKNFLRLCHFKFRFQKPYDAVPRSELSRDVTNNGPNLQNNRPGGLQNMTTASSADWGHALDTSTARASMTSSGQYFQRNSESSYV